MRTATVVQLLGSSGEVLVSECCFECDKGRQRREQAIKICHLDSVCHVSQNAPSTHIPKGTLHS